MNTYLVFERVPLDRAPLREGTYTGNVAEHNLPRENLLPLNCVGAVKAKTPEDAVRAVMAATRRIMDYAVVEAVIVGFNFDTGTQAEAAQLNA